VTGVSSNGSGTGGLTSSQPPQTGLTNPIPLTGVTNQ
jgi:hypothetical protein